VRKFMILGSLVALVMAALALPALAQNLQGDRQDYYEDLWNVFEDRYGDAQGWDDFEDRYQDGFEDQGFFAFADEDNDRLNDDGVGDDGFFGNDRFFDEDGFLFFGDDEDRFDDFDGNGFGGGGVSQSFDQEAQSGDVNQSFNVTNTGNNSNQCAGVQGVANTGNAQNQIGVLQYGSAADDFEFDDSGATIEVNPVNATQCDQAVNQAATASGR
jgi:hypothetical protein